jgi:protein-S-isoprenylcysteine O-methyltransferase Ste14
VSVHTVVSLRDTLILVAGFWFLLFAYWARNAPGTKPKKDHPGTIDRIKDFIIGLVIFVLFAQRFQYLATHMYTLHFDTAILIISPTVCFIGLFVAVWARGTLGTNWSGEVAIKDKHELILTGPYRLVRHPIYTGFCLMMIGSLILGFDLETIVGFIIFCLGIEMRIHKEEQLLEKYFPKTYTLYQKRTKFIIPFIL